MVVGETEGFASEGRKQRLNQGGAQMGYFSIQNIEALKSRVCNYLEFRTLDKFFELGFH